ncbi:GH36-type glycosyl hydrolase domain-containing protein [Arhodomonas sp. AD133]|uniref:GH36-type glycosyl hydrolase domain-containing protein n=1 Tax=Arhodomonas sp. AD133 TaxID=3415009 RepID=UPI003EB6D4A1
MAARGEAAEQGTTTPAADLDAVRPGMRRCFTPIRAELRDFARAVDTLDERVRVLREEPASAEPWMDWYVDNGYVIRRTLRMLQQGLTAGFVAELPIVIANGGQMTPRALLVARLALAEAEKRFDVNVLEALVQERRSGVALNTAELWALPLLLRYECLRTVMTVARERISDDRPAAGRSRERECGTADPVADAVWSLHQLDRADWRRFVERTSEVEATLGDDPCGAYPAMDFETRDRYRGEVEKIARLAGTDEVTVARTAITLARDTAAGGQRAPAGDHVGYFLVGEGRAALEDRIDHHRRWPARLTHWARRHVQRLYLVTLAGLALALTALPGVYAGYLGTWWQALLVAALVAVPALNIASVLINWGVTVTLPPRVLPKLDFGTGIPAEHRTAVCMTLLITDRSDAERALEQLERHYLANRDAQLRYGLLTGLRDSAHAVEPMDAGVLATLRDGIARLNHRHGADDRQPFFWMHRRRTWNQRDGVWMEWERKRGKLHEFNRFVLTGTFGTFVERAGAIDDLRQARYVITLDADTLLPVEAAHRLVGTLAHPLNQAVIDPVTGTVTAGYTIVQPRVEINPVTASRNLFTRIFSGDRGLDIYTLAVSDAYQDLFGEGIYTGKGLYDVAGFEASLANAVPESAVLSHDLFEGVHGRTALVSDVVVYEDYPSDYLAYARRLHRWTRGDWQLLPWLRRRVPTTDGRMRQNPLDAIHRWQIGHNLLRSLQAPMLAGLLLLGWFALPGSPLQWTVLALLTLLVPTLANVVGLLRRPLRRRAVRLAHDLTGDGARWLLAVTFLVQDAWLVLDAIARSVYRTRISGRRLLEWTPAAIEPSGARAGEGGRRFWLGLWSGPAAALAVGGGLAVAQPGALWYAVPVLTLWLLSPQIAVITRREPVVTVEQLRRDDRTHLRRIARRTWLFFEQFVGPDDHWLPPDHFQESPKGVVAHRTSPTNIGLLLVANVTAYDLGYIDAQELAVRSRNTLRTVESMPGFRGHLLNWYDTHHLTVLPPAYVSTVDSGNLLGCLLALKQAMGQLRSEPAWRYATFEGVLDTLGLVEDTLAPYGETPPRRHLYEILHRIREQILAARMRSHHWPWLVEALTEAVQGQLDPAARAVIEEQEALSAQALAELRAWLERVHHDVRRLRRTRDRFLPWWSVLTRPPESAQLDGFPAGVQKAWDDLHAALSPVPAVDELPSLVVHVQPLISALESAAAAELPDGARADLERWLRRLAATLQQVVAPAAALIAVTQEVETTCERLFRATDMSFLYDRARHVFRIGYDVDHGRLDEHAYDLLASEARLASYVAIAKGDVPARHWVHLGRPIGRQNGDTMLLSWSGTLFEYLMPQLLMDEPVTTLLGQSARAAIAAQMRHAAGGGIPWGVSESGYYAFDAAHNYAYHAFGVPALALRPASEHEDVVATPYASFLAMRWRPQAAMDNLRHLESLGMLGRYGFYEALDSTQRRMEVGASRAIVASYMAHHHGMSLVGLGNVLHSCNCITRFAAEPRVRACALLLRERAPRSADMERAANPEPASQTRDTRTPPDIAAWQVQSQTPTPQVHLLSNGRYGVVISNAGGGVSTWNGKALTRWRADPTRDHWGNWLYLRDELTGDVWSIPHLPTQRPGETARVSFHPHAAGYERYDHGLVQRLDVTVSHTRDAELRRVTLVNHGTETRIIRLASYAEIVLGDPRADAQHPAFSKLFVHSEMLGTPPVLVFERQLRDRGGEAVVMGEGVITADGLTAADGFETDRAAFLGRNGSSRRPAGLDAPAGSVGASGYVLDPIASLQKSVEIPPDATASVCFFRVAGSSRDEVLDAAGGFAHWAGVQRTFDEARIASVRTLHAVGVDGEALRDIARLTSAVLYPNPRLRGSPALIARNNLGQPNLWGMGISGDNPIVLMTVTKEPEIDTVRSVLKAHEFWRKRDCIIDVVILNEGDTGYEGDTRDMLQRLFARMGVETWLARPGGIFVVSAAAINEADAVLLQTAASAVIDAAMSLTPQLARLEAAEVALPRLPVKPLGDQSVASMAPLARPRDLQFDNGFGGFADDGREYVIEVRAGHRPPAPWINVIATPDFGFIVSESGGGYTWRLNSGENRLTPWHNDPVQDEPGECIYIRDEETGLVWSPTPQPAGRDGTYLVRHGAGYSHFEHVRHGIRSELRVFVAGEDPVKVARIDLVNDTARPRRLTVTYYAEWVLGAQREASAGFLVPDYDGERRALLVRNPYSIEWPQQVAFLATANHVHGFTTDRREFLGRNRDLAHPAALERIGLAERVECGRDPCAALQVHVDLPANGQHAVTFLLGAAEDADAASSLLDAYRAPADIERAGQTAQAQWESLLGTLTLSSPDPQLDILFNRWLAYQILGGRIHARTGLYQSSGAFGFRDQLQDAMALLPIAPAICRERIVAAAARQFPEGDVLHWWHPPRARGVRTRISDDLLWLAYAVCDYVRVTGDYAVLDERVAYLAGEPLGDGEHERYAEYTASETSATLYEHCLQALARTDRNGAHDLPLIGTGDWNDGMNRVGQQGKGESVWLGWFVLVTLRRFAALSDARGDGATAESLRARAETLSAALRTHGWDGRWYRRGYFDDGTPLGAAGEGECEIDSIAQSWAVLSGGDGSGRETIAMEAVWERLVRVDDGLVLLFTPPFTGQHRDPGYIAAYPPGVRENGGQYTHAACWTALAFARLGDAHRAGAIVDALNPITHTASAPEVARYRTEPYALAADVYAVAPHVGRGGWSWYTGSAAWFHRAVVEGLLGVTRRGDTLEVAPCLPVHWPGCTVHYRFGGSSYRLDITREARAPAGEPVLDAPCRVELIDDRREHHIVVRVRER